MSGFVHLDCHSSWSLLDGTMPAEALPHLAAERGQEAVAMTDVNALTGAARFTRACSDVGVKPIYGAEVTIRGDHLGALTGTTSVPLPRPTCGGAIADHVVLLAQDARGYANLCRLISTAHLGNERGEPSVTAAEVAARSTGLFVLSGGEGSEVARLAAAGRMPEAIAVARAWREAVGADYRLEVFDHRGYGHHALRDRLLKVAAEADVTPVATNDVHYGYPVEAGTHELLHAIKEIVPLSKAHTLRSTSEYFLKTPSEMRDLFWDVPEVADETLAIAEACDFVLDLGTHHFPDLPLPQGETATGLLARRCYAGAERRYGRITQAVEDRLQHELSMIFKMGFAAFFLTVADIVDHVRRGLGIRCACRGSAAGSLVCYVLGISDVDPVRYDLLFERFMNFRRSDMPDIDVDVESARREDVLSYILESYGEEQTAICCMVDTFRARMAIRDTGKAMGLPAGEIDVVAKSFPRIAARDIDAAIERLPELSGSHLDAGQLRRLFDLCRAIDGLPRHLALHPSGVILSSPDLADRVPMQESYGGFTMLQADKDDVEELGLVKLDVLGVRMLSSITHATGEIERVRGERVDLDALPHDDAKAFELVRSSNTIGCFQIESPGQRELLARFQPTCFQDLIVDISLFRPGPVKSDMVSPFLDRRHGFAETTYLHDRLEKVLAETNGVVVFHEQVIRVIAEVTGCSLDDADYVRRHLDAARPAGPDAPSDAPKHEKASSHPGMGRGFREEPEAIAGASAVLEHLAIPVGTGGSNGEGALGEQWIKDQRVVYGGPVAGSIDIQPPAHDVGTWFKTRAVVNGFTPEAAARMWKEVFSFASFGFCKSHAAAFALPTYLSAWLKAHYPAEFYSGLLTHDPGMYPRRMIVADARRNGVPILPVDVTASQGDYRVEPVGDGFGIRLALSEVRDISTAEVDALLDARAARPFTSLEDLWRRAAPSAPVLENLVHLGALDTISGGRDRRELLWRALDLTGRRATRRTTKKLRGSGSDNLPEQLAFELDEPITTSLPELPAYSALEEIEAEIGITGIDARRHLMTLYEPLLDEMGITRFTDLRHKRSDAEVWVAGIKTSSQTPAIRSGQRIIFLTIDDTTGPIEVTVFERVQPWCAATVFHSWLIAIRGYVRKRGGASRTQEMDPTNVGLTVVAEEAFDLAAIAAHRRAGDPLEQSLALLRKRARAGHKQGSSADVRKLWHASGGSAGR